MMIFLPFDTWMRLILWMIVGLDIYLFYSIKHSKLTSVQPNIMRKANKTVGTSGLVLTVILLIVALAHFYTADVHPDTGNINEIGLFFFDCCRDYSFGSLYNRHFEGI